MTWAFAFSEAVPWSSQWAWYPLRGRQWQDYPAQAWKTSPFGPATEWVAPSLVLSCSQGLGRGLALAWSQGDLGRAETQSCREQAGRRLEGSGFRAGMGSQSSGRAKGGGGGVRGARGQAGSSQNTEVQGTQVGVQVEPGEPGRGLLATGCHAPGDLGHVLLNKQEWHCPRPTVTATCVIAAPSRAHTVHKHWRSLAPTVLTAAPRDLRYRDPSSREE